MIKNDIYGQGIIQINPIRFLLVRVEPGNGYFLKISQVIL